MLDLTALLQQCIPEVAPSTMQRIISIESAYNPNVIGYKITKESKVFTLKKQPKTKEEAVSLANWFLKNGYQFDAGISQINSRNFWRYGLTPENVFDPCTNVNVGGKILTDFYQSAAMQYGNGQKALLAAVSAYNSGNFRTGFLNGYVNRFTKSTLGFPKGDYAYSYWNQPAISLVSPKVFSEISASSQRNKNLLADEKNPYMASTEVTEFHHISPASAEQNYVSDE